MTELRTIIMCFLLLSSRQTIDAFRFWDIFSTGNDSPATSEDYTYISVDKIETQPEIKSGQSNPNIKYVHEALYEGADTAHLQKHTIEVTKTVTHEVIRRITVNPICVTARADIPTCFQNDLINGDYQTPNLDHGLLEDDIESQLDIKKVSLEIEPSEITKPILSYLHIAKEAERDPKYFYFNRPTPGLPKKNTKVKEQLQIAEISEAVAHARKKLENFIEKEVVSTIWATRVEKYTNYAITATLRVENCMPYVLEYPICVDKPVNLNMTTATDYGRERIAHPSELKRDDFVVLMNE